MNHQILRCYAKQYRNTGKYLFLEGAADGYTVSVVVGPTTISACVHNASNRAWRGLGRTFGSLANALNGYKSANVKALIQYAADQYPLQEGEPA